MRGRSSLLLIAVVSSCAAAPENAKPGPTREPEPRDAAAPLPAPWPLAPELHSLDGAAEALAIAEQFLTQRSYRRAALEASLLDKTNGYARERLANYALDQRWDSLAEENLPVTALRLDPEGKLTDAEPRPVFDEQVPTTADQWLQLGRSAFESWPAQRNLELEREVQSLPAANMDRLAQLGVWVDDERRLGGLVRVAYQSGARGVSLTCISCHAQVDAEGTLHHGPPSKLALGLLQREPWPPGSADVTDDNWNDPVAFKDLRTTRYESRLHHTGNLSNGLAALAVRVETLLVTSLNAARRPPRPIAFALAYYIWWLGEEERERAPGLEAKALRDHPGAVLFARRCAQCHANELGGGDWIASEEVGTDSRVARSPMRGTGGYRVPVLLGLHERPRGHEARPISLDQWFNPEPSDGLASHPPGGVDRSSERAALVELMNEAFPAR